MLLFILNSLKDNISYYYTPSEIKNINKNSSNVRIGGLVKIGSIKKTLDKEANKEIEFEIEDTDKSTLRVRFIGKNLPMIFREGQGVIVKGRFIDDNIFVANELVTKHDEKYFPPNSSNKYSNKYNNSNK